MELQFQKESLACLGNAFREVKNSELTQEIRLPDGMPDIGRVLGGWGQVILRGKEWRNHDVGISGGLMVWVLYVPEDEQEPRCMESWIPFQMTWDLPDGIPEGTIRCVPILRFVDTRGISARKIMARVGIGVLAETFYPMETEIFTPGELPADVQILRNTYPLNLPVEAGEQVFTLDEDLTIPESQPVPEKILGYSIQPEAPERRVMGNKLVYKGNANLHILYRCAAGQVHAWDAELPFSQYAPLQTDYANDANADLQLAISNLELDMPQPGQLRAKCGMICQYLICDRKAVTLAEDAYSPQRDAEPVTEEAAFPAMLDAASETVIVQQSIPGVSGSMVDLRMYPDFPVQRKTESGIQTEIPVVFQGFSGAEDGTLQSVNGRTSASLTIPADETVRLTMTALPKGNPQTIPSVDGVQITGQVIVRYQTSADRGMPMMTGIRISDAQQEDSDRPSLILCRTGGRSLWQIAKQCHSTVPSICDANGIDDDFSGDRMILVPVS